MIETWSEKKLTRYAVQEIKGERRAGARRPCNGCKRRLHLQIK